MPELPEVETMVRELRPLVVGRRIVQVRLSHDNLLRGVTRDSLVRGLTGQRIVSMERRAKHALIHTSSHLLDVQPGMSGGLEHRRAARPGAVARYDVLTCLLDDDSFLIYRDVRRIGSLRWHTPAQWEQYSARLGPEPLDPDLTPAHFAARLQLKRTAVKKALMDQQVIVGVGNIYANEALFAAGIDPSRRADQVPLQQLEELHHHVRRILSRAIENEGTTFRDYLTSTGQPGHFQDELLVYGRGGEPCRSCGTRLIVTHEIDQRQSVLCWRCQR